MLSGQRHTQAVVWSKAPPVVPTSPDLQEVSR